MPGLRRFLTSSLSIILSTKTLPINGDNHPSLYSPTLSLSVLHAGKVASFLAMPVLRAAPSDTENTLSVVYVFALRFIGAHKQLPGDVGVVAGAAAVEEERRLEEENSLQREEELRL